MRYQQVAAGFELSSNINFCPRQLVNRVAFDYLHRNPKDPVGRNLAKSLFLVDDSISLTDRRAREKFPKILHELRVGHFVVVSQEIVVDFPNRELTWFVHFDRKATRNR